MTPYAKVRTQSTTLRINGVLGSAPDQYREVGVWEALTRSQQGLPAIRELSFLLCGDRSNDWTFSLLRRKIVHARTG